MPGKNKKRLQFSSKFGLPVRRAWFGLPVDKLYVRVPVYAGVFKSAHLFIITGKKLEEEMVFAIEHAPFVQFIIENIADIAHEIYWYEVF